MTRIFALLLGLLALTACKYDGQYQSTSSNSYGSASY